MLYLSEYARVLRSIADNIEKQGERIDRLTEPHTNAYVSSVLGQTARCVTFDCRELSRVLQELNCIAVDLMEKSK